MMRQEWWTEEFRERSGFICLKDEIISMFESGHISSMDFYTQGFRSFFH